MDLQVMHIVELFLLACLQWHSVNNLLTPFASRFCYYCVLISPVNKKGSVTQEGSLKHKSNDENKNVHQ